MEGQQYEGRQRGERKKYIERVEKSSGVKDMMEESSETEKGGGVR